MTNYHIKPGISPSLAAKNSKAKRKKQLEEVEKQRATRQVENF